MALYDEGKVQVVGKELGQLAASATTAATLYTCNASRGARNIWVTVANRSTATTFRVWVDPAGGGDGNEQYKAYGKALPANDTDQIYIGSLEKTDLIRVWADSANLTFTANGEELQ